MRLSAEDCAARERTVARLQARGESVERIARALAVPLGTVRKTVARRERVERIVALRRGGATLEGIAQVIGVSRERVRQLEAKSTDPLVGPAARIDPLRLIRAVRDPATTSIHNIAKTLHSSDAEITRCLKELGLLPAVRRLFRMRKGSRRRAVMEPRREAMVTAVKACAERLGRDPTIHEMYEAIFGHPARSTEAAKTIVTHWSGTADHARNRQALPELRLRAGIVARRRGPSGHLQSQREPKTFHGDRVLTIIRLASFGRSFTTHEVTRKMGSSGYTTLRKLSDAGIILRTGTHGRYVYTKRE